MTTIEDRLVATSGRPAGFDYLRIGLALSIICFHSVVTSYGDKAQDRFVNTWAGPFILLLVPMFFALSGFLVAGSLARTKTVVSFLGLRAIRILPALAVETVLSAFLLGAIFTALPLREYFTSSGFYGYLLNIVGDIHYHLPGVFKGNPTETVNSQLWTIPGELESYLTLTLIFLFGLVSRRAWFLMLFALAQIALWILAALWHGHGTVDLHFPSQLLIVCFLIGVLIYLYRGKVIWSSWLALVCAVASVWLMYYPRGAFYACIPLVYLTIFLGLTHPKRLWLIETGDYPYGLSLYGFPLQQALMAINPSLRHWWINIPLAILVSSAFAAFSWHFVEKRMVKFRPMLYRLEGRALVLFEAGLRRRPASAPSENNS